MGTIKKLIKKLKENIEVQTNRARGQALVVFNITLIVFQALYIYARLKYVNSMIPLWFNERWGELMLAPKNYLYLLPLLSALVLSGALLLEFLFRKYFVRYLKEVLLAFATLVTVMLTYSVLHIIFAASSPFPPLISPLWFSLSVPFAAAFATTYILLPMFIRFAYDNDIVTDPKLHQHPGMVLRQPSVRGGGVFYAGIFLLLSFVFVGLTSKFLGVFTSILMLGILGFMDDYQNTHPKSTFKALENPILRLLLLFSAVAVVVLSGVLITSINSPFGGVLDLTKYQLRIDNTFVSVLIYAVTALWIVWVLNLLSWSNGIDGQYGGIIGIASAFIAILALRFTPLELVHRQVAIMAAISAGIAFGFTKFTWYPSSILWGFGATAAGMVIASLSILINTKIMLSVLILLIPFLDASVIFTRRILQHKSPLLGDRRHFHHLLLDNGWSIPKIAIFYWVTTFIFGLIGLFSSDRYLVQTVLIIGGIIAFVIVLMNLRALKKPLP